VGLDAVVYRNIENLPESLRGQVKIVDSLTGELEFVNGPRLSRRTETLLAADVRIGNISAVAWFREQIESRWSDQCPLILNAVLYSSTHSGDFIPLDQVRRIKLEIAGIDCSEAPIPPRLAGFFEEITQLVNAAETEGNPIAFQ
jgi:hypothetical protein